NLSTLTADLKAGQRIERRRPHDRTRAQIEPGMVPEAANGVPYHDPLGQRSPVMGAGGANGAKAVSLADHHHRLALVLAQKGLPFAQLLGVNALFQVRHAVLDAVRASQVTKCPLRLQDLILPP